jgi:hypothetical protein
MSISAMKQALEAIKETDQRIIPGGLNSDTRTKLQEAIAALRQSIAEAEKQEPVAWMFQHEKTGAVQCELAELDFEYSNPRWKKIAPLYTAPVQEDWYGQHQWQCGYERGWDAAMENRHEFECPRCGHCCRDGLERLCRIMGTFDLATGHADKMDQVLDALESELRDVLGHLRAKREWVWLTYDEINEIYYEYGECRKYGYEEAIQEKLKEKNT